MKRHRDDGEEEEGEKHPTCRHNERGALPEGLTRPSPKPHTDSPPLRPAGDKHIFHAVRGGARKGGRE